MTHGPRNRERHIDKLGYDFGGDERSTGGLRDWSPGEAHRASTM
jgi:hypothetical protein